MGDLEIKIAKDKNDFKDIYNLALNVNANIDDIYAKYLAKNEEGRHSAIVSISNEPVGFWHGSTNNEFNIPCDFNIKKPVFYSHLIFILKDFRKKGLGELIKKHQLNYAKKIGCKSSYCEVDIDNVASLNLQKKLGARYRKNSIDYECCFDLETLEF